MPEHNAVEFLKVACLLALMPAGQGWALGSMYTQFLGCSKSTTYRYLNRLFAKGYLEVRMITKGKQKLSQWRVSDKGKEILAAAGQLPAIELL